MENNQSAPQLPQQPVSVATPAKSHFLPMLIGGILLLIVGAASGYFIASSSSTTPTPQPTVALSPTTMPISVAPTTTTNDLPTDWTTKTSSTCKVTLSIPPKKAPYYIPKTTQGINDEGRYWLFEERANTGDALFTHLVNAYMGNPSELGNDYLSGSVNVLCGPNTSNYTTSSLVTAYEKRYTDGTYSGLTIKEKETVSLWNKDVTKLIIAGGMFDEYPSYLFATPTHVYMITTLSKSENPFVKQTTQKVFENLKFLDN